MLIVMDEMYGQLSLLLASYQLSRRIAMPGSKVNLLLLQAWPMGAHWSYFTPPPFGNDKRSTFWLVKNIMFSSRSSSGSRSSIC